MGDITPEEAEIQRDLWALGDAGLIRNSEWLGEDRWAITLNGGGRIVLRGDQIKPFTQGVMYGVEQADMLDADEWTEATRYDYVLGQMKEEER